MQTVCSLTRRHAKDWFVQSTASRMLAAVLLASFAALPVVRAQETNAPQGDSSRSTRNAATQALPLNKLPRRTQKTLDDVVRNPSFFRRMPTQQIACDPQMLQFLVRRPEVLVNIWELMGITNVSAQRSSPTTFLADDGVGTTCVCDLVYSDNRVHVYYGSGDYDGSMTPRKVKGRCVCVLHTKSYNQRDGSQVVAGTMDVFIKLDNFGADLLTRTLGPFVGKTADYNFVETAKFVAQISQLCMRSPAAAQGLAMRLESIDPAVRREFAGLAARIAANSMPPVPDPNSLPEQDSRYARSRATVNRSQQSIGLPDPAKREDSAAARLPTKREPLFTSRGSGNDSSEAFVPVETPAPQSDSLRLTDGQGEAPSKQFVGSADVPIESIGGAPPLAIRPFKPNAVMRR